MMHTCGGAARCTMEQKRSPVLFFFSSRRRHTRFDCDWSSDVCSSDLHGAERTQGSTGPEETRRRIPELCKHVADDALRQIRIHQDAVRLRVQRAAMTALQLDQCGRVMLHHSLDQFTIRNEGGYPGAWLGHR